MLRDHKGRRNRAEAAYYGLPETTRTRSVTMRVAVLPVARLSGSPPPGTHDSDRVAVPNRLPPAAANTNRSPPTDRASRPGQTAAIAVRGNRPHRPPPRITEAGHAGRRPFDPPGTTGSNAMADARRFPSGPPTAPGPSAAALDGRRPANQNVATCRRARGGGVAAGLPTTAKPTDLGRR